MKFSPININERAKLDIQPGDQVRVWIKIQEKGKTRLQVFEGLVIARKHGSEPGAMFTVRKIASGIGVEKIFPLYSPMIDKIEIVRRSKVRRSKLYYIRYKSAKNIRRKMKVLREFVPVQYQEATPKEETEEEAIPGPGNKEIVDESPKDGKKESKSRNKENESEISQVEVVSEEEGKSKQEIKAEK